MCLIILLLIDTKETTQYFKQKSLITKFKLILFIFAEAMQRIFSTKCSRLSLTFSRFNAILILAYIKQGVWQGRLSIRSIITQETRYSCYRRGSDGSYVTSSCVYSFSRMRAVIKQSLGNLLAFKIRSTRALVDATIIVKCYAL